MLYRTIWWIWWMEEMLAEKRETPMSRKAEVCWIYMDQKRPPGRRHKSELYRGAFYWARGQFTSVRHYWGSDNPWLVFTVWIMVWKWLIIRKCEFWRTDIKFDWRIIRGGKTNLAVHVDMNKFSWRVFQGKTVHTFFSLVLSWTSIFLDKSNNCRSR